MTPELFNRIVLTPALGLLPSHMDSPAARAMIVAICLQESRLRHRKQIGGPARGFAQFERGGGVRGVLMHPATKDHAAAVCVQLSYTPTPEVVYDALSDNDVLAAVFARLLLWTLPQALPGPGEADKGWQQYLSAWRPGKPHPETWAAFYDEAWGKIT